MSKSNFNAALPVLVALTDLPIFKKMEAEGVALPFSLGLGKLAMEVAQHGTKGLVKKPIRNTRFCAMLR